MHHLAFFLVENTLTAWLLHPANSPKNLLIHGENYAYLHDKDDLQAAYDDIHARLRGDSKHIAQEHWVIDDAARSALMTLAHHLGNPQAPTWQVFSWAWLTQRLGFPDARAYSEDEESDNTPLRQYILPWLLAAEESGERQQMQAALEREHADASQALATQRQQLEAENTRLRAQNAALQQVDRENLVRFFLALYPRVFNILAPADLALLCGWVQPLNTPAPSPGPGEDTLRTLQKGFRGLNPQMQRQIVELVAHLPQRQKLQPRPEMRELITQLEGQ